MSRRQTPLRKLLIAEFLPFVILPGLLLAGITYAITPNMWILISGLLLVILHTVYLFRLARAIRNRIDAPMGHFQTTLEDISEGFIVDALPEEQFARAEHEIAEAARKVVHINRMMLRNVDNLEKGFEEERLAKLRQTELTRAYERFVPKQFLSYLRKNSITDVSLGDHVEMQMTVMFADIRSFTTLSEQIQPEDNFHFLNTYFAEMDPVVKAHGGFIDKYIGDGIMALFPQKPDAAIDAALGMLERMGPYNEERAREGRSPIRIGIGLNTGRLMLGIVGGHNRMEGTVISDSVNVASRLEDLNKRYGTVLLLSEQSYGNLTQAERYDIRRIDRITVKGKTQGFLLYECYNSDPDELRAYKTSTKVLFEEALDLVLAGRLEEGGRLFRQLAEGSPGDSVAYYHAERCGAYPDQDSESEMTSNIERKAGEISI